MGIIAERSIQNGILGELGSAIVGQTFRNLRDGDRFWFEHAYPQSVIDEIKGTKLADIVRRNTNATTVTNDLFHHFTWYIIILLLKIKLVGLGSMLANPSIFPSTIPSLPFFPIPILMNFLCNIHIHLLFECGPDDRSYYLWNNHLLFLIFYSQEILVEVFHLFSKPWVKVQKHYLSSH